MAALLIAIVVAAWPLLSLTWALLLVIACLLGVMLYHLRNLDKLVRWAGQPVGTPLPRALGLWNFIFASISRRVRQAYDQRERLSQALARFREASQAMPDGVVYMSRHHIIEWANAAAAEHFSIDAERDVGSVITNLVRQPDFVEHIESGREGEAFLFRPVRREGLTLSIQLIPFGEDQRMILSRDVTQIERLENMRRDFVANVSHELKTPLTVVSGFIEMLQDGLEDFPPEDARRYLGLALDQSGRMQRLIDDLLALSALETGGPQPEEEQVDVQGLLRAVQQDAELLSAGRHRISADLGPAAIIIGSHKELHSAFANLASNAVRYTPAGGEVRLIWQVRDNDACFAVEDSGIGIEPQHLSRLTERFYRVDRGRSRETGGTGLGLAIVKHILTRHQASLEIRSEPGRGSRFAVHFPARRILRPAESKPQ